MMRGAGNEAHALQGTGNPGLVDRAGNTGGVQALQRMGNPGLIDHAGNTGGVQAL